MSYALPFSPDSTFINVSILKNFGFFSFEHLMSFVSAAVNAKSDESIFVPGKIVLPSEGKLRQLSLETTPQLEQTKLRPPRWITQRGALGPFSANILRLFSSSVSYTHLKLPTICSV